MTDRNKNVCEFYHSHMEIKDKTSVNNYHVYGPRETGIVLDLTHMFVGDEEGTQLVNLLERKFDQGVEVIRKESERFDGPTSESDLVEYIRGVLLEFRDRFGCRIIYCGNFEREGNPAILERPDWWDDDFEYRDLEPGSEDFFK